MANHSLKKKEKTVSVDVVHGKAKIEALGYTYGAFLNMFLPIIIIAL